MMPRAAEPTIFLSYRREDTQHLAGRLADRLAQRFGRSSVFMDVDSIAPGEDFVERIRATVATSDVLLAVIGPRWMTISDDMGHRRLEDPEDVIVLEIATALAHDVPVIPILADGAQMPPADKLPENLRRLTRRNAARLDGVSFAAGVTALIDHLEQSLAVDHARVSTHPTPTRHRSRPRMVGRWLKSRRGALAITAVLAAAAYAADAVASNPCGDGRVDDFVGDDLDRERWRVVRENERLKVEDEALKILAARGELQEADNTAENILVQEAPEGGWEVSAKFNGTFNDDYQQAGIIAYEDDDNYAKAGMMAKKGELGERAFELVHEEDGQPRNSRPLDSMTVARDFPDTYYVRMSNDGEVLKAYSSQDGQDWTEVGRPVRAESLDDPDVGIYAFTGITGAPNVWVAVDHFNVSPDGCQG